MNATGRIRGGGNVLLSAQRARRALQLAEWMAEEAGDRATRAKCLDLAAALRRGLETLGEHDELAETRRRYWREKSADYRERKRATAGGAVPT